MVAPFVDVGTLVGTYRVAGTIPLLSPLARFPILFEYLTTLIVDKWSSKDRIASYIRAAENKEAQYLITIIHAEDDYDIPSSHSQLLFWHAVNAASNQGISPTELSMNSEIMTKLGSSGTVREWKTRNGIIREEIYNYGLHDVIMGNPVVSLAVMRTIASIEI